MRKLIRWASLFWMCLFITTSTSAKPWKNIVPLKSTRTDVDALLRSKGTGVENITTYITKREKVIVTYSVGDCSESSDADWNVPRDTVISLEVFPLKATTLVSLGEDLSLFEKRSSPAKDLPGMVDYLNWKEGFTISVDEHGLGGLPLVASIGYSPSAAQESLRCRNARQIRGLSHLIFPTMRGQDFVTDLCHFFQITNKSVANTFLKVDQK